MMTMKKSVNEKILCKRMNKFFYLDEAGRKRKYSQYCVHNDCKIESLYNYENLKETKYCKKHKLEHMVNVKRGHSLCLNCRESHKKICQSPQCKYTIEKYKTASKYMKRKIINI